MLCERGVRMKNELYDCEIVEVHPEKVSQLNKEMMNQESFHMLSEFFKMFSDATRLKILSLLFKEELCVCDIAEVLEMTHSAVSHQLSVLRQNRIIKFRRSGKNVYYSLDDEHIQMIYNAGLSHVLE